MSDQMQNKLGAYLDGELNPRARLEVETHLKECEACREELEALRHLSALLKDTPQEEFIPPQQFKAQVLLQISRLPDNPQNATLHRTWLWLGPVLVFVSLLFIQVTYAIANLLTLAQQTGLFIGSTAGFNNTSQVMQWFAFLQSVLPSMVNPVLQYGLIIANNIDLSLQNMMIIFIIQMAAAAIYWLSLTLALRKSGHEGLFSNN